jgi:hypothetical protein
MSDPSAADPGPGFPREEPNAFLPPRAAPPGVPRPSKQSLRSLLEAGLPEPPVDDFEEIHESLAEKLDRSRRDREEQEAVLLQRADELVADLRARVAEVEAQLNRLDFLRQGFRELGEFGTSGLFEVESHLERLRRHHEHLRSILEVPALQNARERLRRRVGQERDNLLARLDHEAVREEVEKVVGAILERIEPPESDWARQAVLSFEENVREWRRFHHLPAIARFWRELADRIAETDPAGAASAREREEELSHEIERRASMKKVNEEARRFALEVREAVADLESLGPETRKVQMHLWLGNLRRYQDDFELDDGVKKEVYLTFGSINRARKDCGVRGFIDALNRNFRTNWDEYVREWEMRLEAARVQDRLDEEEDERLEREREERERLSAEERARSEERLREITEMLTEIAGDDVWRSEPEVQDDVREMLLAAVDQGGCQSEEFLAVAREFAPLAHGADFRKLRRSLSKRGVDFDEIELLEPERAYGPDEELFRKRAPVWEGKTIAIVGGLPREQVRRRIQEGLGLREARWYEYYRDTCEQDPAESAIRSGAVDLVLLLIRYAGHKINEIKEVSRLAGVECRVIDRGCGVTSILRGLATAGGEPAAG